MQTIDLDIHGGGQLEIYGSLADRRLVLMLSRENFRLDDPLLERMTKFFTGRNLTVVRYQSEAAVTSRLIDRKRFERLPILLRQGIKTVLLLLRPTRWRHFSKRHREKMNSVPFRVQALRELLAFLRPGKEIVIVSRSASGRVASQLADEARVTKLICLGYPFKHPAMPDEPDRYAHLPAVRTPFLILQGARDIYGGRETAGRYPLSPATTLEWIETGHDFALDEREWSAVLARIGGFVGD